MIQLEKPICFFDLETTGTDTAQDRIIEISILKYSPDGTKEVKTKRVNPLVQIPAGATAVHGISDEDVAGCPSFAAISRGVLAFIEGCDLAGFNSNNFDIPLLYNEFFRAGVEWNWEGCRFIDVGNIFKRKEERTLSAAVKFYCGKELEGAHGAEADITATADVFFSQLSKYEDLPKDLNALALYSNFDKEVVDIGGRFTKDTDGDYVFTFGKHKGNKCKNHLDYIQWMTGSAFPPDTMKICKGLLSNIYA